MFQIDEAIEYLTALECAEDSGEDLYYSDEEEENESADDEDEDSEGATGPAPSSNDASQLNIVLTRNSPLLTE